MYCRPDGSKGLMMPASVLAIMVRQHAPVPWGPVGNYMHLYNQCLNCQCPDDAPGIPTIAEGGRPACAPEAASEPDETAEPDSPAQSPAIAAQPDDCVMQTCSPFYGSPNPADCDDAHDKMFQALEEYVTPNQPEGSGNRFAEKCNFVDRSDYARMTQRHPAVRLIAMPFTVFTGRESLHIGQDHRLTAYQVPVS